MNIPQRNINVGNVGMLTQDPLAIVNTPTPTPQPTGMMSAQQSKEEKEKASFLQDRGSNWFAPNALTGFDGGGRSANPMTVGSGTDSYINDKVLSVMEETGIGGGSVDEYNNLLSSFSSYEGTPKEFINDYNSFLDTKVQEEYNSVKKELESRGITNIPESQIKNTIADKYGITVGATNQIELDPYKRLQINSDGSVEYIDNTPSNFQQFAPAVTQAAIIGVATAGVGSALAGSSVFSGLAPGVAQGLGQAVASGTVSAIQGGDPKDILKDAVIGGIGGYAKGATKAASEATKAASVVGATAEAAETAKALQATADIANQVKDVVGLAQAVDNKNVLGVISNGLKVSGIGSLGKVTTDTIKGIDPTNKYLMSNADELAAATLSVTDKLIKGASIDEALASGIATYVKEGGSLNIMGEENKDSILNTIAETASQINKDYIRPVLDTAGEVASGVNKEYIRPVLDAAGEVVDPIVDPIADTVRETGRDIRETADPVANVVRDAGREAEELLPDGSDVLNGLGSALLGLGGAALAGGQQGQGGQVAQRPQVNPLQYDLEPTELTEDIFSYGNAFRRTI